MNAFLFLAVFGGMTRVAVAPVATPSAYVAMPPGPSPVSLPTASPPEASAATESPPRPAELRLALDAALVSVVSSEALKRVIRDPRPEGSQWGGYSFPSGHTAVAFSVAKVASDYQPSNSWLWYALAAGVAWSRVRAGDHDWDDVIAGAALGYYLGDIELERGGLVLARW